MVKWPQTLGHIMDNINDWILICGNKQEIVPNKKKMWMEYTELTYILE